MKSLVIISNTEVEDLTNHYRRRTTDEKTFHFNLQSNGILDKSMKLEIRNLKMDVCLIGRVSDNLIHLGEIVLKR